MKEKIASVLKKHKLYAQKIAKRLKGFTLIELLIVFTIIGILASFITPRLQAARSKTYMSRARSEFKTMNTALTQYFLDNNTYPPDANRDIPPGLGAYLAGYQTATWPKAPWPGSVYDWENWTDVGGAKIYQISIRFCPAGGALNTCKFPDEPWAANFGVNSSVYYCVEGACRSHVNESPSYPGYCVNC